MKNEGELTVRRFNVARTTQRDLDELVGLCKGVIADGDVNDAEARFLLDWLDRHPAIARAWPGSELAQALSRVMEEGADQSAAEGELLRVAAAMAGATTFDQPLEVGSGSTALPLDDPPPAVVFPGKVFCFTGRFELAARAAAAEMTEALGGAVVKKPTKKTSYLVIGAAGSRDWLHSTHGLKILRAMELRDQGVPLAIISELVWRAACEQGLGG